MSKVEQAAELFSSGLNCGQSILTAFGEPLGLTREMAKILGRPLGGGMGRTGRTCGAITAAVLILGLANNDSNEEEARKAVYPKIQEFLKQFEAIHNSCECKDLLGADMSTGEGRIKIQEEKLVSQLCPAFIKDAARILEPLLLRK
jgi:C_GCAxxG_C_C family probable redox protein